MEEELKEYLKSRERTIVDLDCLKSRGELGVAELNLLWDYLQRCHQTIFITGFKVKAPASDDERKQLDDLVTKIKHKLEENCFLYPNDFTHALLSEHVYYDFDASSTDRKVSLPDQDKAARFNQYLVDWEVQDVVNNLSTGYFSILYVNKKSKKLVLAHRGTDLTSLKDIDTDLKSIVFGSLEGQAQDCYEMTKKAVDYYQELLRADSDYIFSITGHSLGAWLAELSIFYCYFNFNCGNVKVVNFESPGSYRHLVGLKAALKQPSTYDLSDLNIVTYLSPPNLVNTCNQHIGIIYSLNRIKIEHTETENLVIDTLKCFSHFLAGAAATLKGHLLDYFLEDFDPATGKPRSCVLVKEWPCLFIKESGSADERSDQGALSSMCTFFAKWKSGEVNFESSQFAAFLKHFDLDSITDSAVSAKPDEAVDGDLELSKELKLKYEAHYQIEAKKNYSGVLNPQVVDSQDYFLYNLYRKSVKAFNKTDEKHKALLEVRRLVKIQQFGGFYVAEVRNREIKLSHLQLILFRILKGEPTLKDFLRSIPGLGPNISEFYPRIHEGQLVKRDACLKAIDDAFKTKNVVALLGPSGVGKSTLAMQYAETFSLDDAKSIAVWFYSDRLEKIEARLDRILANDFAMDAFSLATMSADAKFSTLLKLVKGARGFNYLFVFDNIKPEHVSMVATLAKAAPGNLKILATGKKEILASKMAVGVVEPPPFTSEEAKERAQARLAGKLPTEALASLIESHFSSATNPYLLDKMLAVVSIRLADDPNQDASKLTEGLSGSNAIQLLLEKAAGDHDCAAIMNYLAFCDPDQISLDFLRQLGFHSKQVGKLKAYSLVDEVFFQFSGEFLRLPRPTQDAIISWFEARPDRASRASDVFKSLETALPVIGEIPDERWLAADDVYLHAWKLSTAASSDKEALVRKSSLLNKLYRIEAYLNANWASARALEQANLATLGKIFNDDGKDHAEIAASNYDLAVAALNAGDAKTAVKYFQDSLYMRRRLFKNEPDNPLVVLTSQKLDQARRQTSSCLCCC